MWDSNDSFKNNSIMRLSAAQGLNLVDAMMNIQEKNKSSFPVSSIHWLIRCLKWISAILFLKTFTHQQRFKSTAFNQPATLRGSKTEIKT